MTRKTIYCAQEFWRREGQLRAGALHRFHNEERAIEGGKLLAAQADGVAVFSLTGEADVDFWDEPVILVLHGDAPGGDALDQREVA